MNKAIRWFILFSLGAVSCKSGFQTSLFSKGPEKIPNPKIIVFMISSDVIQSRIEQDRMVRISEIPSIQGYQYIKNVMLAGADTLELAKTTEAAGFTHILVSCYSNSDSLPDLSTLGQVYNEEVRPFLFNPLYSKKFPKGCIVTWLFSIKTGEAEWIGITYPFSPDKLSVIFTRTQLATNKIVSKHLR